MPTIYNSVSSGASVAPRYTWVRYVLLAAGMMSELNHPIRGTDPYIRSPQGPWLSPNPESIQHLLSRTDALVTPGCGLACPLSLAARPLKGRSTSMLQASPVPSLVQPFFRSIGACQPNGRCSSFSSANSRLGFLLQPYLLCFNFPSRSSPSLSNDVASRLGPIRTSDRASAPDGSLLADQSLNTDRPSSLF